MTERQLVQRLVKQLREEYPDVYWGILGDTFGGHKKTGDTINCINGKYVVIEYKVEGKSVPSKHQLDCERDVIKANGQYYFAYFSEDGKTLELDCVKCFYEQGRYTNIDLFIESF